MTYAIAMAVLRHFTGTSGLDSGVSVIYSTCRLDSGASVFYRYMPSRRRRFGVLQVHAVSAAALRHLPGTRVSFRRWRLRTPSFGNSAPALDRYRWTSYEITPYRQPYSCTLQVKLCKENKGMLGSNRGDVDIHHVPSVVHARY